MKKDNFSEEPDPSKASPPADFVPITGNPENGNYLDFYEEGLGGDPPPED